MSHVAPLPRLTAETDQLTIQSRGIFHLPPSLILCKSSDGTACPAWKTPLSTFVSQSGLNPCVYFAPGDSFAISGPNKVEAYNGFAKWLFFGGEGIIAENDPEEQEKMIKY